ncbi:hypothetical protein DF16_orf04875 [Bacillus thuringiensis serovar kurstaki str. YBT-1520]|nr:hypothetical protein DF16_orf04875 [Bacillus thuringiensis serovar kurstaki str. YBT-1520]EDZ54091.1 hypothetical protein BCAH1134_1211 [Bacillus cereus AH1134]EEK63309.1 hypothetical protein bcere0005_10420 [Bacillus cereus 172560W]EEL57303.1 hypothetical protein bcere0023_11250 [Bacillus cereus Rock4-2]KEH48148.1 hypothetical protein BG09_3194 [Bacillus thuringiensis serovar kurstaki str. HD-1]KZD47769.1 hypothetical protein B4084_3050 [Bacillus cereus]
MIKLGLIVEFVLYMYLADLIENKKKTPQDVSPFDLNYFS